MDGDVEFVMIGDKKFVLDGVNALLYEHGDPLNTISFHKMRYNGRYYELDFNREAGTAVFNYPIDDPKQVEKVILKSLVELAPTATIARYGTVANPDRNDNMLRCADEAINKRIKAGNPPMLSINGYYYEVDLKAGVLRAEHWGDSLFLKDFGFSYFGDSRYCFFDVRERKITQLTEIGAEYPPNIVMVTIPSDKELDPVAYARMRGEEDRRYIHQHPIREIRANVFHLAQTHVRQLVKSTREKIGQAAWKERNVRKRKGL